MHRSGNEERQEPRRRDRCSQHRGCLRHATEPQKADTEAGYRRISGGSAGAGPCVAPVRRWRRRVTSPRPAGVSGTLTTVRPDAAKAWQCLGQVCESLGQHDEGVAPASRIHAAAAGPGGRVRRGRAMFGQARPDGGSHDRAAGHDRAASAPRRELAQRAGRADRGTIRQHSTRFWCNAIVIALSSTSRITCSGANTHELSRSLTAPLANCMVAMVPGRKTPEPPDETAAATTDARQDECARRGADVRISPAGKASSSARADTAAPSASCSTVSKWPTSLQHLRRNRGEQDPSTHIQALRYAAIWRACQAAVVAKTDLSA